ncbi:GNAT family N-acetyltransferase [Pseudodesulfovibrio sp. zrk46]|uniref:GNAT family N-acetyltransferase n=1 Tax=Pseudodesulfovibrio sp. zrk46 TaxID=2725288 RepID=UPI001448B627|nr:GNAT family N-acetyltransferase [Pseudodesulfovibrio sp. zrk46]QJB56788.1 GNAT family N-acetyltransferase [Pseudodesulfovibrio sp. zrk46]
MPEVVKIRPATHEDLPVLISLLESLFSIEEDFEIDPERQRSGLEMMLSNGRGRILAAETPDGTVVGMCSGQLTISTAEGGPAVLVEDVIVHEDWRGKGVGAKLMDGLTDWARTLEAPRMQLLADKQNVRALDFYKHLGWQPTQLICLRKRL